MSDRPTGPKEAKSTVLSIEDEAIVVAFRPPHAAAARRLPLRPADDDPASDALVAASLPAAPRHLAAARGRRRQAGPAQVQDLRDRLLPQSTLPKCGRRKASCTSSWRSTGRRSSPSSSCTRRRPPASPATSFGRLIKAGTLPHPHDPDRQRHPVHGSSQPRLRIVCNPTSYRSGRDLPRPCVRIRLAPRTTSITG